MVLLFYLISSAVRCYFDAVAGSVIDSSGILGQLVAQYHVGIKEVNL